MLGALRSGLGAYEHRDSPKEQERHGRDGGPAYTDLHRGYPHMPTSVQAREAKGNIDREDRLLSLLSTSEGSGSSDVKTSITVGHHRHIPS